MSSTHWRALPTSTVSVYLVSITIVSFVDRVMVLSFGTVVGVGIGLACCEWCGAVVWSQFERTCNTAVMLVTTCEYSSVCHTFEVIGVC